VGRVQRCHKTRRGDPRWLINQPGVVDPPALFAERMAEAGL